MADIFLSYTREDGAIAKLLGERLESLGWSVGWDREIPVGQTRREVIEQSLAGMGCMVVLWSKQSIDRHWVKEAAEAGHAQGKLVPALIDDVQPPVGFRVIEAANLIDWDGSKESLGLQNLIESLVAQLGKPIERSATAAASAIEASPAVQRQQNPPDRFDFARLCEFANILPWWSYATATVLVTVLIAATIGYDQPDRQHSSAVSLPVHNLDAGEILLSAPLTLRGPTPQAKSSEPSLTSVIDNARDSSAEKIPAKRSGASRSNDTPISTTAPTP